MSFFFTSDEHYGHRNILRFQGRPFATIEEHDAELIRRHNAVVGPEDTVIHAGDFTLAGPQFAKRVLDQLHGRHVFVRGSHDKWLRKAQSPVLFDPVHEILELVIEGQPVVVCHYAMRVWARSHYGAWNLHGHCVDLQTEILTPSGWKGRNDIQVGDKIISYNHALRSLEVDAITEIIDQPGYSGPIYDFHSKSISMRVTPEHTIPRFSFGGDANLMYEEPARQFFRRKKAILLRASVLPSEGIDLSDDLLRLCILIAADGTIKKETNLVRFVLTKERKRAYLRSILNRAGIPWREHPKSNGQEISINFYMPEQLRSFRMKGLDDRLLGCSDKQFLVILEAYGQSDGCINGDGVLIYSAKEPEIDLLQALAVKSGYGATKHSRHHGFAGKMQHQLSVFPAGMTTIASLQQNSKIENVVDEHFWCIRCKNQNFMMRHRGKVHLTGNSHGRLPPIGKQLDVGVDCHDFAPVSWHKVVELMATREDNPNLVKRRGLKCARETESESGS